MHHVEFGAGLTVLRVASLRSAVVPELVCARSLDEPGLVHWIDAGTVASTHALYNRGLVVPELTQDSGPNATDRPVRPRPAAVVDGGGS